MTRSACRTIAALALLIALLSACASRPPIAAADTRAENPLVATPAARQVVVTVRNGRAPSAQNAGSSGGGYGGLARYQVSPAARREADAIARRHGLRQVAAWPIEVLDVHCIVYRVDGEREIESVLRELRADRDVESAQPLQEFRPLTRGADDDPYVGLQDGLAEMQVQQAHRWSRGAGVRIAVIDSGIDASHPDLAGRIGFLRDVTGAGTGDASRDTHGTAVAGVIAANAGNGLGIVGIAPDATLLALRACWQQPAATGPATVCNTLTLAKALALCFSEGADIINLSLAGPPDPLLERLVRRALDRGKIVVAAVPERVDAVGAAFPASVPGVLAVASADRAPPAAFARALRAPGRNVLTLRPGARYDFESGSSMAAANVSGIVALLRSIRRDVGLVEILAVLGGEPQPHDVAGPATASGVNACRALVALRGTGDCEDLRRIHAAR